MVQNGQGFMHSVSLKSHGPVLFSMKLLPYPVNQSCFSSALDKLKFGTVSGSGTGPLDYGATGPVPDP